MTAVEGSKSAKKTSSEAATEAADAAAAAAAASGEATEEKDKENDDQNRVDQNDANTSDLFCFDCKSSLAKSQHIINIAGQSRRWHPECFKCTICREPMDEKQSCHVYKDQIVCRSDYTRLKRANAVCCARCRLPISASDWVRRASSYVYHIACFNCDICLRQLNTGEQFIVSAHPSDRSNSNSNGQRDDTTGGGDVRLLCRLHFTVDDPSSNRARDNNSINQMQKGNAKKSSQESCRKGSTPKSKSPGLAGHELLSATPPTSAPASTSKQQLARATDNTDNELSSSLESSQYQLVAHHSEQMSAHQVTLHQQLQLKQSAPVAVTSTSQLWAQATSSCAPTAFLSSLEIDQQPTTVQSMLLTNRLVDRGEQSMRQISNASIKQHNENNQHHFSSSSASTSTTNHDHPVLHEHDQRRLTATTITTTTNTTTLLSLSSSSSASSTPTSSSILNTTTYLSGPMTPTNVGGGIGAGQQALSSKSKRVRTTFTEDQLSILQTHFQIDSNPDGQDLERIATITGLSKRVTQVWFQNSRARQKKYMIKRKPSQLGGTIGLVTTTSYNMVAASSSAMTSLPSLALTSERTFQSTSSSIGSASAASGASISDDQLSILQAHFQIDSIPDDEDLERIATIANLSKRVTQVWFQNYRANGGSGAGCSTACNNNRDKAGDYYQQRFRLPDYSPSEANPFNPGSSDQQLQLLQGGPSGGTGYAGKASNKPGTSPAVWLKSPTEMVDDEMVDEHFDGSPSSDEYHLVMSDEGSLEAPNN